MESYEYGPYGEIEIFDINSSSVSASQIENPFTYTGRRLDEETGLYYYRARHYSSALKRFLQRDPTGYVDGPNEYAYVGGRATSFVDPMGLTSFPGLAHAVKQAAESSEEEEKGDDSAGDDTTKKLLDTVRNHLGDDAVPPDDDVKPHPGMAVGGGETWPDGKGGMQVFIGTQGAEDVMCPCQNGWHYAELAATLRHEKKAHHDQGKKKSAERGDGSGPTLKDIRAEDNEDHAGDFAADAEFADDLADEYDDKIPLCPCPCELTWWGAPGDMRRSAEKSRTRAQLWRKKMVDAAIVPVPRTAGVSSRSHVRRSRRQCGAGDPNSALRAESRSTPAVLPYSSGSRCCGGDLDSRCGAAHDALRVGGVQRMA